MNVGKDKNQALQKQAVPSDSQTLQINRRCIPKRASAVIDYNVGQCIDEGLNLKQPLIALFSEAGIPSDTSETI